MAELRPALEAVIAGYRDGTDYGIHMDTDGLIAAGAPGLQLTWMDAKVGDWVVTPRQGKPVEISALWYNALRCAQDLAQHLDWPDQTSRLGEQVARSFREVFWNAADGCLYDVADPPDPALRPNQILAVSLPFAALEGERAAAVVRTVHERLWTPYGLRSLAPGDPAYRGRYGGDQVERDSAYHQGTIWGWLMGPFVSAYVRVHRGSAQARREAAAMLQGMRDHLGDAGLGTIAEIFEGDPPHAPRGCISQAWSVGEVLRAYVEDVLGEGGPP
jgi:predicted glycogen debranching enzyme